MSAPLFTGCLVLLASPQGPEVRRSPLEEVIANVQAQPLGPGTVSDLALPEDLLRRLSDRILRRSFEDHFRIVIAAPVPVAQTPAAPADVRQVEHRGAFRTVLDVLALGALGVLAFLGFFAWKARARRKG